MASYSSLLLLALLPSLFPSVIAAVDINKILSQFPDYSTFNTYLTQTQLAASIDSRQTITVLTVQNSAMAALSTQPLDIQKKLLGVHVILDYYDDTKLKNLPNKTAILTTLFQSSGQAVGQTGFLNVTVTSGGQIDFSSAVPGSQVDANFVKVVVTHPYNISVLQISALIVPPGVGTGSLNHSVPATSPAAKAADSPTPSASPTAKSPSQAPSPSKGSHSPAAKAPAPSDAASPSNGSHSPAAKAPAPSDAASPSNGSHSPAGKAPAPSDAASPDADAPEASSPSPPAPPKAKKGSVADAPDAPGPAGGNSPSAAAGVVAGAGVGVVAIGAAFLGAL